MHLKSKNLKCTSSNWKNKNMFFSLNQLGGGREDQKSKKNPKYIFKTNIILKRILQNKKRPEGGWKEKKVQV